MKTLLIDGSIFSDEGSSYGIKTVWKILLPKLGKAFSTYVFLYKNVLPEFSFIENCFLIHSQHSHKNSFSGEFSYELDFLPDAFLSTQFTYPSPRVCSTSILLVHDLIHKQYYGQTSWSKHIQQSQCFSKSSFFITISEETKKQLILLENIPEYKIIPCHLSANDSFFPEERNKCLRTLKKYQIYRKYFLIVGYPLPHKNRASMIRAFNAFNSVYNNSYQLIVITPSISKIQMDGNILKIPRGVTPTELRHLYSCSEGLLFASKFEGFGIPILEAQKCRCPVLTSNCSSMPEVAGHGAVLVNPYDINSLTDGLFLLTQKKNKLILLGLENVKRFSWDSFTSNFVSAVTNFLS